QGTADVDGSPLAAKFAQAARMAAASASWSALSGTWNGAPGSSKRDGSSDGCVATGGSRKFGGPTRPGARSAVNSGGTRRACRAVHRAGGGGGRAKFASPTAALKARVGEA